MKSISGNVGLAKTAEKSFFLLHRSCKHVFETTVAIEHEIIMSPELWAKLQEFGNVRQLKKNEYLLDAGQTFHYGNFVNSGSLVNTFINQNGNDVIHGFSLMKPAICSRKQAVFVRAGLLPFA
ncbi:MAG: hypothetical protein KGZ82_13375 [Bacteroidales bacterium]|nr:hypothetical protein [Bacteroidales bacterium]